MPPTQDAREGLCNGGRPEKPSGGRRVKIYMTAETAWFSVVAALSFADAPKLEFQSSIPS